MGSKLHYDLILGTETMKDLGIALDVKANKIIIYEIIFQMRNINHLKGASTLNVLKLNNSLAMEPQSTHDAAKHASRS